MKITILDGHTINPGDLDWKPILELGECTVFERTDAKDTYERSKDSEILITSKVEFDRDLIFKLPRLKYIGVIATGYNVIDLKAAKEKEIVVTNVKNYSTNSVAQMVFAHIFEHIRRVGHHNESVKKGDWSRSPDFCYWDYPQNELGGKVLGLVGFGNIGQAVGKIAAAFDMKVIVYDNYVKEKVSSEVEFVDFDTIFKESDILSLHCPLTSETKEIVNKTTLSKMKKNALIVNTARGPLINDNDLADALNGHQIAGAGLDVLSVEPPSSDCPLLTAENCYITPHIAWASKTSRELLIKLTADNIKAFMAGNPINVVN